MEAVLSNAARNKALQNYRARLSQRGFIRIEITALETDRELFRSLARRLAEGGPQADRLRATVQIAMAGEPPEPANILAALRRSPLVDADIDLSRPREEARRVDL